MQVVLVDDSQTNLVLLKNLIEKLDGCMVIPFAVSQKALDWCEANDPDLIIVDYSMPAPDGVQCIKKIRQMSGKNFTPIIMISANYHKETRYEALEAGANDFLNKPIDSVEFLARVKNFFFLRKNYKMLIGKSGMTATPQISTREKELIMRLSKAVEYRYPQTQNHIERVAYYSLHIAKNLRLSPEEQELIFKATPMHDIGKIGIPDYILLKPDRLTEFEITIMKQHTLTGYELLKDSSDKLLQLAADIALTHHEKYDGTGYPNGLRGNEIPLAGRITAVADVFDNLISAKTYRKALDIDKAVKLLQAEIGRHFDPQCINAFFQNWGNVLEVRKYCGGDVFHQEKT